MFHLFIGTTKPFDLRDMQLQLQEAHDYFARQAGLTLAEEAATGDVAIWGESVGQARVNLPPGGGPELAVDAPPAHSVNEVHDQCANVGRLIDTLKWCLTPGSGFADASGVVCNPTTSSDATTQADLMDHDLVVRDRDGRYAYFEVSDVASDRDGYFKEPEDLVRLGVLEPGLPGSRETFHHDGVVWPPHRLFLVASSEFARYVRNTERSWRKLPSSHVQYRDRSGAGETRVTEVLPGLN